MSKVDVLGCVCATVWSPWTVDDSVESRERGIMRILFLLVLDWDYSDVQIQEKLNLSEIIY
jgi:hypothetical protein